MASRISLTQQFAQLAEPAPEDDEEQSQISDDDPFSEYSDHPFQHTPTVADPQEAMRSEAGAPSDLASALRATREQDRRKGKAVIHQITLWDTLLDARIRLQKGVALLNNGSPSQLETASTDPAIAPSLHQMLTEALALSEDLSNLQESILRTDGTASIIRPRKRAKTSRILNESDHTTQLRLLSADASTFEAAYHPYLIQTLAKWSAKIQAINPTILLSASHATFKHSLRGAKTASNLGVVDVIDATLSSDTPKLLTRTRTWSGKIYSDNDNNDEDGSMHEGDSNVFDDTDFYQQLLRDVIELRGANGNVGEQDWVCRQKARKAKKKRTIDTKASKGRKLRYQIHEKLQNFMVPIFTLHGGWHEEQIDELFASLLGSQM